MSNGYTNVVIAQKACRMAGVEPVASLDPNEPDADTTQNVLEENYELVVQELLVREYWRFASKQAQLLISTSTPLSRWQYAYELPNTEELLDLQTILVGEEPIEYDLYGRNVYCDYGSNNTVVADYTYRAPENEWSPGFTMGVVQSLAGIIAIAVQERPEAYTAFNTQAEQTLARAATRDAMSHTNRSLPRGTFTKGRPGFASRLKRR